jgi:hypothetical protein
MADEEKRPADLLAERGFLREPRPEHIVAFAGGAEVCDFTIGVKLITHTRDGLKIIPTHYVIFALKNKNGEEFVDLPSDTVRYLIPRLHEMCDAADKLNEASNGR